MRSDAQRFLFRAPRGAEPCIRAFSALSGGRKTAAGHDHEGNEAPLHGHALACGGSIVWQRIAGSSRWSASGNAATAPRRPSGNAVPRRFPSGPHVRQVAPRSATGTASHNHDGVTVACLGTGGVSDQRMDLNLPNLIRSTQCQAGAAAKRDWGRSRFNRGCTLRSGMARNGRCVGSVFGRTGPGLCHLA